MEFYFSFRLRLLDHCRLDKLTKESLFQLTPASSLSSLKNDDFCLTSKTSSGAGRADFVRCVVSSFWTWATEKLVEVGVPVFEPVEG